MERKFKSLVTIYHDYDANCIETIKPQKDGDFTPEYIYARKGSVFVLHKYCGFIMLKNKALYITLDNEKEIDNLIERGWFKEIE